MERPVIQEAIFVDAADAAINSMVLREIYRQLKVGDRMPKRAPHGYCQFTRMPEVWGVRIEDQHDSGEETPHYVLEVGFGEYKQHCLRNVYHVNYCDYRSVLKGEEKDIAENCILVNPGRYTITIWLLRNRCTDRQIDGVADAVNDAYYNAMVVALPNYAILTERIVYEGARL
ncbi:hypothetical protein IKG06_01660 [Candidatus Saccharibacteria bacterium]|nr:hypothetical protein [Candidatus Saccharibacteria bacterium]